jgi:outer membrane lipoprotein-sorting protein
MRQGSSRPLLEAPAAAFSAIVRAPAPPVQLERKRPPKGPGLAATLGWALALSFLAVSLAQAAEFSAAVVNRIAGHEMQGKIFVRGQKARLETSTPLGVAISILRLDKKVMWILMPGKKAYMEMPFDREGFAQALNIPTDEAGMQLLGRETLNGYDTEKYATSMQAGTRQIQGTMWISKRLGLPIKIESADHSFSQEYRNIREGGVDDAIFEIPAGSQKLSLPAGLPQLK